jgi:hypothetical protein
VTDASTRDQSLRIAIATDAWAPQINGVVTTLAETIKHLRAEGHAVETITPDMFRTIRLPTDRDIRVAAWPWGGVAVRLAAFRPDVLHIATEGTIGWAARRSALGRGLPFTTAFHTRFPEYLAARMGVPASWCYALLRRFHGPAAATLAPTTTIVEVLRERGFTNPQLWSRGVDLATFRPVAAAALDFERPVFLYVGRLAPEKGLDGFLSLDLPGTKVVIGDGPSHEALRRRYPRTRFLGPKPHAALASFYSAADVLAFPSRTDTFGLVLLEAMACGTPVAARPAPGPLDVVGDGGVLDHDLAQACRAALTIPRERAIARAQLFSWRACTADFIRHLRAALRARPADAQERETRPQTFSSRR